jgi:hypothetical protein
MTDVAQVMDLPIARQLLHDEPLLRLSYIARDGGPRVIPIGYLWDGTSFLMWTIPRSAKVAALRADPRVAITVDVVGPPPRLLLARGRAVLDEVEGVPDGYLEASHRTMPPQGWADFDSQVRSLYERMTTIVVTPDWARLVDFETTLPQAVEEVARARAGREG